MSPTRSPTRSPTDCFRPPEPSAIAAPTDSAATNHNAVSHQSNGDHQFLAFVGIPGRAYVVQRYWARTPPPFGPPSTPPTPPLPGVSSPSIPPRRHPARRRSTAPTITPEIRFPTMNRNSRTNIAKLWVAAALLFAGLGSFAAPYFSNSFTSGFQNSGVIPDGSLNGWSDTRTVSGCRSPSCLRCSSGPDAFRRG